MAGTQGLFVIGTDTGVGKTLITCAIVRLLRAQGVDAVGFKPMASGAENGVWSDAEDLVAASENCEPLDLICPVRFAAPLAPTIAAQKEGRESSIQPANEAFETLCARHRAVVVEGVGGMLVPLDRATLLADFAAKTGFPILLVCRAGLGTINHTLLTLRELARQNLRLAGIFMNVTAPADAALAKDSRIEIERIGGVSIAAVMPFLSETQDGGPAVRSALALQELRKQLDVGRLLGARLVCGMCGVLIFSRIWF